MTQQKRQSGKITGQRYWQAHVAAFDKSGLSRAGYCRQHNLSTHALVYWQKKFKQTEKSTSRLVPVMVPVAEATVTNRAGGATLHLILSDKLSIAVSDHFSPQALNKLLATLEGR